MLQTKMNQNKQPKWPGIQTETLLALFYFSQKTRVKKSDQNKMGLTTYILAFAEITGMMLNGLERDKTRPLKMVPPPRSTEFDSHQTLKSQVNRLVSVYI